MIKIFKLLFELRNVKPEKLKISFKNLFFIHKFFIKHKISKEMKFKMFYYIVIDESINNATIFSISCDNVLKKININE